MPRLVGYVNAQLNDLVTYSSGELISSIISTEIAPFLISNKWISRVNRYGRQTIERIDQDIQSNTVVEKDLKDYMAVSTLLHCNDGWEFLNNSITSLLNGSYEKSIHFAYYAELRAAMSFLATNGIAVLNDRHFCLDGFGNVYWTSAKRGTHRFTWEILDLWSNQTRNASKINENLFLHGISFNDWLTGAGIPSNSPALAISPSSWLRRWNIDIQMLSSDRDIRNQVSYRPSRLRTAYSYVPKILEELDYLAKNWRLLEPSPLSSSHRLDLELLKMSLYSSLERHTGILQTKSDIKNALSNVESSTGIKISKPVQRYLLNKTSTSALIYKANLSAIDSRNRIRPMSVISRAFLMLRLSTLSVKRVLLDSTVSFDDVKFWWNSIGLNKGFWNENSNVGPMSDLWSDIELSIDNIELEINRGSINDRRDLFSYVSLDTAIISQVERACLWTLEY